MQKCKDVVRWKMTHNCRVCEVELNDDNWYPSFQKGGNYLCKECDKERCRVYRKANQDKLKEYACLHREEHSEKVKAINTRHQRKNGALPFDENKECTSYYGVYINEGLLKRYFNDVEVMPYGYPGYDFICNNGWKIDGKSSFTGDKGCWEFRINHNTTADYFFCVAYDNRKDKNIIHIWILPGDKFNHLMGASISKSTIDKWAEYEQPIDKLSACCNKIRYQ